MEKFVCDEKTTAREDEGKLLNNKSEDEEKRKKNHIDFVLKSLNKSCR